MKKIFPARLTQRFLFLGTLLIILPLSIVIYIGITSSQDIIQTQTEQQAIQVAKTLSEKTTTLFDYKMDLLQNIALNKKFANELEDDKISELTMELAVNDPFFEAISVVDQEGKVINRAPMDQNKEQLSPTIKKLFEDMTWMRTSLVSESKDQSVPSIYLLVPFQEQVDTEVTGGLIAKVNFSYLQAYFKKNIMGYGGRSFLINQNGDVLVDTKELDTIGVSLKSIGFVDNAYLDRTGVYRGDLLGHQSLIAYSPIDRHSFIAVTSLPLEEAGAAVSTLKNILIKGFLMILFAAFILLLLSIRWVIEPIKTLTREVYGYAQGGDWQINILKEKDEMATLSKAMKYMANSLKEKERYLYLILESFPFGVVTINPDGIITSFNKTAKNLLQFDRNNIIGKGIDTLPISLKSHFEQCKITSPYFEGIEDEFAFVNQNGKKVIMKRTSTPLLDEEDQVIGVVTTFWDITKVRQLESHIQRSEQLAAIGQMTAGLAHEVKNPLGTVQMASDLIDSEFEELVHINDLQGRSVDVLREAFKDIQEEMQRLDDIVKRFLLFSRENKKVESIFDLSQLINDTLHLLSHQFKKKQIKVEMNLPNACFIEGDQNLMTQALLNIFLNSIEAIKQDGKISVSIEKVGEKFEIAIEDNGIGIPDSKIKRIFNPFFSTKQEGTGLGLWITHDIIESHKGFIEVDSQEGNGTIFFISLPVHNDE